MKYQTKARTVLERTSHYLKVGVLKEKPAWYDVVGAHPPNVNLTKKPNLFNNGAQKPDPKFSLFDKTEMYKTRMHANDRKQHNNDVSRVPKLEFLEDELRNVFYHQHPWEFSRPKNLVENSGDDNANCDWSTMLQFNKPLDGESVVQRTIFLLQESKKTQPLSIFEAYDKARYEFYQLRMQEEMDSAVSREESTLYGAVYPVTNLEWGLQQEQQYINDWAQVAQEKTKIARANEGKNDSMGALLDTPQNDTNMWTT